MPFHSRRRDVPALRASRSFHEKGRQMRRGTYATPWRILAPIALAVAVLVIWQLLSGTGAISTQFLPSPAALAVRVAVELGHPTIWQHAAVTLTEAVLGTLLAALIALPLGYAVARVRAISLAAMPYIIASQAVPAIAIAPLLALWIGYGLPPIVLLCAVIAFFPMLITTIIGLRSLDREIVEAAVLDGAGWWPRLVHIEAPLAAPSVLAGVRAGAALSVTGAVVGEFTMGGQGLGMLLTLYRDAYDTEGLFAVLIVLVALALALFGLVGLIQRLLPRVEAPTGLEAARLSVSAKRSAQ